MKKKDLDDYFNKQYKVLLKTTQIKLLKNNKLYIEPDSLLNNCYIYIHDLIEKGKITEYKQMESYIINFICKESYWTMGKTSKQEKINNNMYGDVFDNYDTNSDDDINEKIKLETIYNNQKSAIAIYRQTDFEKEIIASLYFDKKINTSKALGEHLNMSTNYGWEIIKKMKKEINDIYNKLYENNER